MARKKKDGVHVNLFLSREVWDRFREYADKKGQTLTTAMERILAEHLAREQAQSGKGEDNVRH